MGFLGLSAYKYTVSRMDSFKNFEKSSKNFIKTFGFIKKNTTFVSGFDNQSSAPGRFPVKETDNENF